MGLIKYKRVVQRIKEEYQYKEFPINALEDAIFLECGTDTRTVKSAIDRLIRLKYVIRTNPIREFGIMPTKKFKLGEPESMF